MTVYVVTEGEHEDKFIVAIFSSKEIADEVKAGCQRKSNERLVYRGEPIEVVEYELNPDHVKLIAEYP